jgi:hypothetical protein
VAIIVFEWVAQLGLIGGLLALLWADSRVSSSPLRYAATFFFSLTLVAWFTPSILWALVPPECEGIVCSLPSPWSIVGTLSHNAAHWLAFFGVAAWAFAVFTRRRGSGA